MSERGSLFRLRFFDDRILLSERFQRQNLFAHEPGKRNLSDQDSLERKAAINQLLLPDIITLQFGEKLVPLFVEETKQKFPHVMELRKQAAGQWGVRGQFYPCFPPPCSFLHCLGDT